MNVAVSFLLLGLSIGLFVFWIWGVVDAVRFDERTYRIADVSQVTWVVCMVLFGWLATVVWVAGARRKLKETEVRIAAGGYPRRVAGRSDDVEKKPVDLSKTRAWGPVTDI